MPELPDLLYIQKRLTATIRGRTIGDVDVRQPIILRNTLDGALADVLKGQPIGGIHVRGPFLRFECGENVEIILNLMLAGRLQLQKPGEKGIGHLCLSLHLDDGMRLNCADEKKMSKVYIVRKGEYGAVTKYREQGLDILSPLFTTQALQSLARARRRTQIRVFINDQAALSAIGNAYADDILFDARIHPKTLVGRLSTEDLDRLYHSITAVIRRGTNAVETAAQPIEVKVRDHMLVRNKKGEPCPRCGATIRREGVRGHDVFFCPHCQPPSRSLFLDWRKLSESGHLS